MRGLPILLLFACISTSFAFFFDITAGTKRCFLEELTPDELFVGEYRILPSYSQEIDIMVTDPGSSLMYSKSRAVEGKFAFTSTVGGEHKVCFDNRLSPGMAYSEGLKTRIELNTKTGVDAKDYTDIAKSESLRPIEVELKRMEEEIEEIQKQAQYFRRREERHRDTNESTNARVMWFSIFWIAILLGIGVWQMIHMKNFFKAKKLV
eukprot:GCRY01001204.1.p1 GENE.GCRY01001204.1~~GCRY01001204.1.p1  ORF type:complete len:228 (+),score=14.03 GCRY01001204.1:66-686(+)